jgi:rod shape determining protein RodA
MTAYLERPGLFPRRLRRLRHLDVVLLGAVLALSGIGLVAIYSATRGDMEAAGVDPSYYLKRQAAWVAVGLVLVVGVALVDLWWIRRSAGFWYVATLILLVLVMTPVGVTAQGAQRWVQLGPLQLQPSEFAEVSLILLLAAWCARSAGALPVDRLAGALVITAVPAVLVVRQPNLGTSMVFAVIVLAMVFYAGARMRYLAALGLLVVVGATAAISFGVLHDYQAQRIAGFVNPTGDSDAGYNLRQSQVAIGAGGLTGTGLFQGSQTSLSFVPEQSTDFIFTVIGEELGFRGTALVLGLFGVVVWRVWRIAALADDRFASLVCVGVLALLVFKIFQNIGMTVEMMPITGIPLPFVSYGGSSTIASFIAVGLVLDVGMRRWG